MPRQDYDAIKNKFGTFVSTWKNRDVALLDDVIDPEVICYIGPAEKLKQSKPHSIPRGKREGDERRAKGI